MNKKELEQFVAEHDAQIAITIHVAAAWPVDVVKDTLWVFGFIEGPDGRIESLGKPELTLSIGAVDCKKAQRITLVLNVACSSPNDRAIETMLEFAPLIARKFNGTLVDDNGMPLSDAALAQLRKQVETFYASMEASGIPAGSPEALRLFAKDRISNPPRSPRRYSVFNVFNAFTAGVNLLGAIYMAGSGNVQWAIFCGAFAFFGIAMGLAAPDALDEQKSKVGAAPPVCEKELLE